jgi:hypothetical protein
LKLGSLDGHTPTGASSCFALFQLTTVGPFASCAVEMIKLVPAVLQGPPAWCSFCLQDSIQLSELDFWTTGAAE